MKSFEIDDRLIGQDHPPYVIAEISGNHNGSLERALELIRIAKEAGADAVKTQTYTPDTITLKSNDPEFTINGGLWDGKTLYDLYEWAHTPWEWNTELFAYANELGITMFSSVFDNSSADLLQQFDCPAYKIASFEAVDLPLIEYTASKQKPMIISTGMASVDEISEAIRAAYGGGCESIAILHCVSGYPAPAQDYNLRTIPYLRERFGIEVGLSDHTLDNATAVASVALGVRIIEKHFTLSRSDGGPDDAFSLEPDELAGLCDDVKTAWLSLGKVDLSKQSSESGNVQFRRSLYFVNDLPVGSTVKDQDIRSVRPGFGLAPKHRNEVIGSRLSRPVRANSPVTWDDLERK